MGDEKLREKMRRSPAGWRLRELHKLYRSYGFDGYDPQILDTPPL